MLRLFARREAPPWKIRLDTIQALHEHGYEIRAHCPRRNRDSVVDLEGLVLLGKGGIQFPFRLRCSRCGESGQGQLRPWMPTHEMPTGWMQLPPGQS